MSMTEALTRVSKQYCDRTPATFSLSATPAVDISGNDATITLAEFPGIEMIVDWGDATVETVYSPAEHTYAGAATYAATVDVPGLPELAWSDDIVIA